MWKELLISNIFLVSSNSIILVAARVCSEFPWRTSRIPLPALLPFHTRAAVCSAQRSERCAVLPWQKLSPMSLLGAFTIDFVTGPLHSFQGRKEVSKVCVFLFSAMKKCSLPQPEVENALLSSFQIVSDDPCVCCHFTTSGCNCQSSVFEALRWCLVAFHCTDL